MNPELQKKWFVYIQDHHEGPFSVDDLQAKLDETLINEESYVWCEGMGDWEKLASQTQLMHQLNRPSMKTETPEQTETELKLEPQLELKNPSPQAKTIAEDQITKSRKNKSSEKKSPAGKNRILKLSLVFTLGLLLFTFATLSLLSHFAPNSVHTSIRPFLVKLVDRAPMLSGAFQLIPKINDLSSEKKQELQQAQVGLPSHGVKIAVALVQSDPVHPYFYISTNLPHGTRLMVQILGNSETLLNRLYYHQSMEVTSEHGFAQTSRFEVDGGQPIPKGEYQIWVSEASQQAPEIEKALIMLPNQKPQTALPNIIPNDAQFVFSQTVFLGGKRDETYLTRLRAFHDRVRLNAQKELTELKQYADTLMLQFSSLESEFDKVFKASKVTPSVRLKWQRATGSWKQINSQLDQTIQTWAPEILQSDYFYGATFELVKSAFESLKELYKLESEYMENPSNSDSFSIQHGKLLSEARESTETLRAKVEALLQAPKSPSGLPLRQVDTR